MDGRAIAAYALSGLGGMRSKYVSQGVALYCLKDVALILSLNEPVYTGLILLILRFYAEKYFVTPKIKHSFVSNFGILESLNF
jgi:hypothetical protein